ncbi:hypothetical protein EDB85DRAFT_1856926 [Lactarius pseudohatsudake]|nr:hypothetical protein EDB85DRAFT_1856926 [Lactarius pseudohatsudake]
MAAAISYSPRRPPPPTSYKPSTSTLPQSKRNHDLIRPRLPTDPFSNNAFRQRDPIVLNAERLFHTASTSHPRRDVILVLGVPSTTDLAPLFNSERLVFSLLIIASHQPPLVPPKVQPAVRILHLTAPLGLEQAGAIRFVNTLEWAERVARVWRKEGGIGVRELTESDQDGFGALTPPPKFLGQHSKSNTPSPVSSTSHLDSAASSVPTASSLGKRSFFKKLSLRSERALPSPDSSQRPFDALVNFLPHNVSDKSLLKQAILVTTISRPFLVAATPPSHSPPTRPSAPKRGSVFSRISIYSMPPTPPLGSRDSLSSLVTGTPFSQSPQIKPRLVHLLPPRPRNSVTNRVLHSIESFLLSFSFPPALEIKTTDGLEPARTCLLESAAFAEPIGTPPSLNINWTVADVLLSGCLDDEPTPRAWLSGAADIIVASPPPTQHSPPIARRDPHTPASLDVNARSNLGISALPTPPDSEEDTSSRHTLPVAKGSSHKHALGWKFWRRRMASDTSR